MAIDRRAGTTKPFVYGSVPTVLVGMLPECVSSQLSGSVRPLSVLAPHLYIMLTIDQSLLTPTPREDSSCLFFLSSCQRSELYEHVVLVRMVSTVTYLLHYYCLVPIQQSQLSLLPSVIATFFEEEADVSLVGSFMIGR
jgi:hypothetical protein